VQTSDRWGLKQSYSPRQEFFNGMSHIACTQGNRVDSQLLMVGSQTANLTLGPSFSHNLCFRCPNGSCEPILDIYVSIDFQWYEEFLKPLVFHLCNHFLNIWESTGTPIPNMGVHLGMWGFFPSHSFALSRHENVTPGLSLGSHPYKPFALVVSSRLGSRHYNYKKFRMLRMVRIR
jgi:hypothetical protein